MGGYSLRVTLLPAVGRARMGRDAVRRQGATRRGLNARNEEQRRRRAAAWLSRVRSGVTQKVRTVVCSEVNSHQAFLAEPSGQLPEVG